MEFTLIENPNGTFTLQECESAQNMHSKIGAWEEAVLIYSNQTDFNTTSIIHDVGLGIAANALSAITAHQSSQSTRDLLIQSFEKYPDGIKAGLEQMEHFDFLKKNEATVNTLLDTGEWRSENGLVHWELYCGDYFELIHTHPKIQIPDILYFDFYAPKTCPALWGQDRFTELKKFLENTPAKLITYSAATSIRSALILAGFTVGPGTVTPYKSETTIASNYKDLVTHPFSSGFLEKIKASSQPFPLDWEIDSTPGEPYFERKREILLRQLANRFDEHDRLR